MCRHSLYGTRQAPWLPKAAGRDWSASGRRGAEADDARPREVRLRNSSGEVAEQNRGTGSGGDGAKGGGRGEREPATHAPDTEPGKRVTDAGARTDGRKVLPSISEVGAGCGKAARPVLGGGTRVTRFPTAIANRKLPTSPPGFPLSVRGRDVRRRTPPAQIRTSGFPASGSYLGCLTAKRMLGQGCR